MGYVTSVMSQPLIAHGADCAGFHEVFTTDDHLVIVMEHASGGQLDACIEASGRFAESKARGLFLQIVDAVAFCHK